MRLQTDNPLAQLERLVDTGIWQIERLAMPVKHGAG